MDTRQREQRAVDLTQLDPPPAQLDLVVLPAAEEQALGVVDHEVAAAVGALPAEGRHGGVLLGVLHGIEVAGQTDPADDQLTRGAGRYRHAVGVDDREVPAVEREADPDRPFLGESRPARDHRGLGRAVGVPHLAPLAHQPGRELGRAGLAPQDQEADLLEGLVGPQRHQGGHRRHDRDAVGDEPRRDVDATADERSGSGHEAPAVPPRQPHLLTARVEGDRQSGHHAVAGSERYVLQEQPRLGVHERRGVPVRDRDPLGRAGRAGGEDDPRVVVGGRAHSFARGPCAADDQGQVHADDGRDVGLVEDQAGAFVGVVGVDRDIGSAGHQHRHDRDVQVARSRGEAYADPVAASDADAGQLVGDLFGRLGELLVGQHVGAVVDGAFVRGQQHRGAEDVDQRPRRWGELAAEKTHGMHPTAGR